MTKPAFNDPRLRAKKTIQAVPEPTPIVPVVPVTTMSQDELLRKAQEQMAALAQMEKAPSGPIGEQKPVIVVGVPQQQQQQQQHPVGYNPSQPSANSPSSLAPKVSFQWKKKK